MMVFENLISGACPQGFNKFQYIAIGNNIATRVVSAIMTELDTNVASLTGCTVSDEMARNGITFVSSDFTLATSGTGVIVVLDTSSSMFDVEASNTCNESIPTSNIFSVQDLNLDTGLQYLVKIACL